MRGPVDVVTRLLHYHGENRSGKAREVAGSPKRLHLRKWTQEWSSGGRRWRLKAEMENLLACSWTFREPPSFIPFTAREDDKQLRLMEFY